jgi:undecaprenyl diphosphate synthase
VTNLMGLLATFLRDEVDELAAHGVRLVTIGDEARLPDPVCARLAEAKRRTAGGRGLLLCLALSYGSREAIVAATRTLARAAAAGADPAAIDETAFAAALDSHLLPPLDLVVRTSGEQRLSNFLLWEAAYAELHFTEVLWPDFARADLEAALAAFARRRRRFGLSDSVELEHAVPSDAATTPAVVEPSAPSSAMCSETWSEQRRQPASAARRERRQRRRQERAQRRRQERAERRRRRQERARRRREAVSAHSTAAIANEVIEVQAHG